jgi:PhnB protein
MKDFHPYITFEGNCEEALRFYEHCFAGKILYIQYYDEAAAFGAEALKSKVMHSEFQSGPVHFMACDKSSNQIEVNSGTNLTLYIAFDNGSEQERIFKKLSEQGKINFGLEKTIWGSIVGLLTDKFGVQWMLVLNED